MATPPTRPLPFPSKNNCYIYTPSNKRDKPQLVQALEIMENLKGKQGPYAYFYDNLVVSKEKWDNFYTQFTPIDCKNPKPEAQGYQKKYIDGGRRKNKSRRNKRKNRKTRRH